MIKFISLIFFISVTFSQDIIFIKITDDDLRELGHWPIKRKWFAFAAETAFDRGAKEMFINLSFVNEEKNNPESDQYLYSVLKEKNIKTLHSKRDNKQSFTILGKKEITTEKSFPVLSDLVSFEKTYLRLKSDSVFNKKGLKGKIVSLPDKDPRFINFIDFLNSTENLNSKTIFIGTEITGVSSFFLDPVTNLKFSDSALYFHLLNTITTGNFKSKLGLETILYYNLSLIFFIYLLRRKSKRQRQLIVIHILFSLIYVFRDDYIISFELLFLLLPLLYYAVVQWKQINTKKQEISESRDKEKEKLIQEKNELAGKLSFYDIKEKLDYDFSNESIIHSKDSPIRDCLKRLKKISEKDITVLLEGETGTGKELFATFIHENSSRTQGNFVTINCASIPENLIESELFGHEKGAFTSAHKQKKGLVEEADGGTLFLDEIAECSIALQAKLLRFIENGTFYPVGSNKIQESNVRIIAASHQSLKELSENKQFRSDLYFRLNGYHLIIPALRERTMDLELLLDFFIQNRNFDYSTALLNSLKKEKWKGNVREFKSAIERAITNAEIAERTILLPNDFFPDQTIAKHDKRDTILHLLRTYKFSYRSNSRVAEDLDMHRSSIIEYLKAWLIHFYVKNGFSFEKAIVELKSGAEIDNEKQFMKRMRDYLDGTQSKIIKNNQEILLRKVPEYFHDDYLSLIKDIKNKEKKSVEIG